MGNYDDIINLEYKKSLKHPHMSLESRSAQFQPFAALTGYEGKVIEKGRITDKKIELDEDEKLKLDMKLQYVLDNASKNEKVKITYFVPDLKKEGGKYEVINGVIKKIDNVYNKVILSSKEEIDIDDILDINSEILNKLF